MRTLRQIAPVRFGPGPPPTWVVCRSGDIPVYTAAPGNAAVYTAVYTAAPRYILQYIPRRRGIFRECQYMVACVPVFGNRFFFSPVLLFLIYLSPSF